MLISDQDLETYGELFVRLGIRRYMEFSRFIANPRMHLARLAAALEGDMPLPLLRAQESVRDRLDRQPTTVNNLKRACRQIDCVLGEWERALEQHRRVENGHILETMKHHRHPR